MPMRGASMGSDSCPSSCASVISIDESKAPALCPSDASTVTRYMLSSFASVGFSKSGETLKRRVPSSSIVNASLSSPDNDKVGDYTFRVGRGEPAYGLG